MPSGFQGTGKVQVLCILALLAIVAVPAAGYTIAPVIEQGGTVFFGGQGLNVTHALNQAYWLGTTGNPGTRAQNNSAPPLTAIGWWPSPDFLYVSSPSRVIDLGVASRYRSLTIAPADFVGYTGTWYLLAANGTQPVGPTGDVSIAFVIQDPSLDLRIMDYTRNMNVTGKNTTRGDELGFRIRTNQYAALDKRYRSPVYPSGLSGYIDIRVRNESGYNFTSLLDGTGTFRSLLRQNVTTDPWDWGNPSSPVSPHAWATGRKSAAIAYLPGRYSVWAESGLNGMKDNYRMGGTEYTGKTVSRVYTVSLVNPAPAITVTVPNGGQAWQQGSVYRIAWNYTGNPGAAVRIELLKGAVLNRVINASTSTGTSGSGSYLWTVPFNQAPGTDYRIRVTSTGNPAYRDTGNANFTIRAGAPLTITVPNGGQTWSRKTVHAIAWKYTGNYGNFVKIELLKGMAFNRLIVANTSIGSAGSGSRSWTVPADQIDGSDYRVRISIVGKPLRNDTSNADFHIASLVYPTPTPTPTHTLLSAPGDR